MLSGYCVAGLFREPFDYFMALELHSDRIVIAGASSLLGAELKSLLEESRFAACDFRLLDEELAAGTLTEAGGEPAVIQRVEEGSFAKARFVFFTGSPEFTKANLAPARSAGARVIDLSGGSLGESGTRIWYPQSEKTPEKNSVCAVLSAPGMVAVSLLDALSRVGLYGLGIIFFRPVSEAGRNGVEELETQTSQLLSMQTAGHSVFGAQVAFSMLDRYGSESGEDLAKTRQRIVREVTPFSGKRALMPSLQVVHAPVFYGYTFAALAETASSATPEKLAEVCAGAGIRLHKSADGPLGNLSADDASIHLALPEEAVSSARAWWSWGAVDNVKAPAAQAAKLAELLAS